LLPLLRRLGGREGPGWSEGWARLESGQLSATPGLTTVVPLAVRNGGVYSRYHGSASISSLAEAVGFTVLPPGTGVVPEGAPVRGRPPPRTVKPAVPVPGRGSS